MTDTVAAEFNAGLVPLVGWDSLWLYLKPIWNAGYRLMVAAHPGERGGGRPREPKFITGLPEPGRLAISEKYIYWESGTHAIGRALRDGSNPEPEWVKLAVPLQRTGPGGGSLIYNSYLFALTTIDGRSAVTRINPTTGEIIEDWLAVGAVGEETKEPEKPLTFKFFAEPREKDWIAVWLCLKPTTEELPQPTGYRLYMEANGGPWRFKLARFHGGVETVLAEYESAGLATEFHDVELQIVANILTVKLDGEVVIGVGDELTPLTDARLGIEGKNALRFGLVDFAYNGAIIDSFRRPKENPLSNEARWTKLPSCNNTGEVFDEEFGWVAHNVAGNSGAYWNEVAGGPAEGIVADGEYLYWCWQSEGGGRISRARRADAAVVGHLALPDENPHSLAISGRVLTYASGERLVSVSVEGGATTGVLNYGARVPSQLALDTFTGAWVWNQAATEALQTQRAETAEAWFLPEPGANVEGVAVLGEYLYWSTSAGNIGRARLDEIFPIEDPAIYEFRLEKRLGGSSLLTPAYLETGLEGWHAIEMTNDSGHLTVRLDGVLILAADDAAFKGGYIGIDGFRAKALGLRNFSANGVPIDDLGRIEDPLSNGGRWLVLPWEADTGQDSGEEGWQPHPSAGAGAYWSPQWYGVPEDEVPELPNPEEPPAEPPAPAVAGASVGVIPFRRRSV